MARRTLPPTLVDTRPVSGYGVTFFREYDGAVWRETFEPIPNTCAGDRSMHSVVHVFLFVKLGNSVEG